MNNTELKEKIEEILEGLTLECCNAAILDITEGYSYEHKVGVKEASTKIKSLIEAENNKNNESIARGFYEFVKQGEYFDKKNLEQIHTEIELYIVRDYPTRDLTQKQEEI